MSQAERERGEELHALLTEHVVVDHDGWAFDLVHRVAWGSARPPSSCRLDGEQSHPPVESGR